MEICQVIGETCNDTGKIEGIVKIKMLESLAGRSFSVYSSGRAVPFIFREPIDREEFQFTLPSGNYFIEIFNEEGCVNPNPTRIVLSSKGQVSFTAPNRITVCETFVFIPMEAGNYSLTVSSFEGCQYSTEFLVKKTCELMIQSTTGMKVNDPERPFLVYTNYLVDQLDIWIYNKWGQLVYHCSKTNLSQGELVFGMGILMERQFSRVVIL